MTVLKLKDELETIDFLDGTNYELEEDSFIASYPKKNEIYSDSPFFAGRDLVDLNYGPRDVTFNAYIYGATQKALADNVGKLTRLLTRASMNPYLNGGSYAQDTEYTQGKDTGDQGVILQIRRGSDSLGNITSEADNSTETNQGLYTLRVISGDLSLPEKIFSAVDQTADGTYFRKATINLYTEPFFVGPSTVVAVVDDPGLYGGAISPANSRGNRIFIDAASVPGDVDALTRIGTHLSGSGIIIARDAGISLLNSVTRPIHTGTGRRDMFAWGFRRSNTNYNMRIRIKATGFFAEYSLDGGNTYEEGNVNISQNIPVQVGSTDVWLHFGRTGSHYTPGDYWDFVTHQSYFGAGSAIDMYNNKLNFYSDNGITIETLQLTVPPGCRGRYKVLAQIDGDFANEYSMRVYSTSFTYTGADIATEPQVYEWTGPFDVGSNLVDLGIIDLGSTSSPHLSHPYAATNLNVAIRARTLQYIDSSAAGQDYTQLLMAYLIPIQDEFSYFQVGWKEDTTNAEVYSNYDPNYPYVAEQNTDFYDQWNVAAKYVNLLDATYAGNVITLIPNVDQTIIAFPLSGPNTDWRSQAVAANKTGHIYVAIRPRYLYLPS